MKFSWKLAALWTIPVLVIGFFVWQGAFTPVTAEVSKNTASTRMTYGRFLEYLDANRVKAQR